MHINFACCVFLLNIQQSTTLHGLCEYTISMMQHFDNSEIYFFYGGVKRSKESCRFTFRNAFLSEGGCNRMPASVVVRSTTNRKVSAIKHTVYSLVSPVDDFYFFHIFYLLHIS